LTRRCSRSQTGQKHWVPSLFQQPLKGSQADADLAAGADQACANGMGLTDQLERLAPVSGSGQPSASSEQKASHFFRSTNKAGISVIAVSFRWSSFMRALISSYSWTRTFSSSFYSFKVSNGFSLASWDACR